MKVYLITSGEYSDYHIDAVSLDEKEAERICGMLNKNRYCDTCDIEIYDTDEVKVDSNEEILDRFWMQVGYKTGKMYCYDSPVTVLGENNEIKVDRGYPHESRINITATLPKGTTEDKAKKIMFDRIAKFKAERATI